MLYNPAAINDVASWFALLASIPAAIAALSFSFLVPWYRTWLGFSIWGWLTSTVAVLIFVVTRRFWGAYWGYEWLAIVVYSALAFFMTTFLIIFFVERRRASLFEFSIRRRPRKES